MTEPLPPRADDAGPLDRLHLAARRIPGLQRLAILSRLLLAGAFLPAGMVKLLGQRFTALPPDNPVGAFFEALYQSGAYWHFLGLGQVLAALCLLIPATTTLGAVLFFPIILNITVITWSIGFAGTRWITLLMLVASVFLLCWDFDRLKGVLFEPRQRVAVPRAPVPAVEWLGYGLGALAGLGLLGTAMGLVPVGALQVLLGLGVVGALLVLVGWWQACRRTLGAQGV